MGMTGSRARRWLIGSIAIAALATRLAGQSGVAPVSQVQPSSSPQARPAPPAPGTGFLMGQVVDAASKRAVGGAIVSITGSTVPVVVAGESVSNNPLATSAPDVPRQILTGGGGQFLFRALPAGRYQIRVTAPGYISGGYGQVRANGSVQSVELTRDDEKRVDLNIRLWKTAAITGKVRDEAGEPVMAIDVRAFRRTLVNGKPRFAMAGIVGTDDRGIYRLAGMVPGDYVIAMMSSTTTMPAATTDTYIQTMMSGGTGTLEMARELSNSDAPYPASGGYRVGEFIVAVGSGLRGGTSPPPSADESRMLAYPTWFYPAGTTPGQASVITLVSGDERANIDLQIKPVPTYRVSGAVTGPDGPVRNLGMKLLPVHVDEFTSGSGVEVAATATDANGAFTFFGVPPGQYFVRSLRVPRPIVSSSSSSSMSTSIEVTGPNGAIMGMSSGLGPSNAPPPPLPVDPTLYGSMAITVGDADMAGVSLVLHPGARLSGRFVFDGAGDPPSADLLQRASLSITPVSGTSPVGLLSAAKRVETDGRFATVGYPPGRYTVSAFIPTAVGPSPTQPPAGGTTWRFRSATVGGRDVNDDGLAVDADDITTIVITFSNRSSDVTGTVMDEKGQPDKTASVIVIPSDSQTWKQGTPNPRRVRTTRPGTSGAFAITDLPPGSYFIAAVSDEALDNLQDPKTLEAITRVATRFTLGDGEKLTQSLTTRVIR